MAMVAQLGAGQVPSSCPPLGVGHGVLEQAWLCLLQEAMAPIVAQLANMNEELARLSSFIEAAGLGQSGTAGTVGFTLVPPAPPALSGTPSLSTQPAVSAGAPAGALLPTAAASPGAALTMAPEPRSGASGGVAGSQRSIVVEVYTEQGERVFRRWECLPVGGWREDPTRGASVANDTSRASGGGERDAMGHRRISGSNEFGSLNIGETIADANHARWSFSPTNTMRFEGDVSVSSQPSEIDYAYLPPFAAPLLRDGDASVSSQTSEIDDAAAGRFIRFPPSWASGSRVEAVTGEFR